MKLMTETSVRWLTEMLADVHEGCTLGQAMQLLSLGDMQSGEPFPKNKKFKNGPNWDAMVDELYRTQSRVFGENVSIGSWDLRHGYEDTVRLLEEAMA